MSRNSKKIVIGGGISGLIWKWFNPDFHIISPDLGGFYAKTHLVWLHDTSYTRKLLEELKLTVKPKKSYIGYCYNDWISDYQNDWLNEEIIKRKMTPWNQPIDENFKPRSRDLSLSVVGENNFMNTLDVDLEEVVKRLGEYADIEQGYVTQIESDTVEIKKDWKDTDSDVRHFDVLVSTMSAPLFWKAYGIDPGIEFKSSPITSVIVGKKPEMFDNSYEMIYYTRKYPFSRISHLKGKWALEFTGEITKEEFQTLYPNLTVLEHFVVKHGRIWENEKHKPPQDNIIFSGRFSQWKYKVVTETVLAQVINYQITNFHATHQFVNS